MTERRLLMIPGPIEIEPDVALALARPPRSHLDPEFVDTFGRALERVREIFLAPSAAPFVVAGTGTLAMELGANAVIEPGDPVLVVDTGYFGDRMARLCERLGAEVSRVSAEPGRMPELEAIARALPGKRAVTMTHVDTSTGARAPVREIAALAAEHGAISIVDGVCSIGGEELRQEAWGVDVALTASQKALGAPPGLAVLALSPRALERYRARRKKPASLYADVGEWLPIMQAYEARKGAYFATPAVQLVTALEASLQRIAREGMEARAARHARISGAFRAAWDALGLAQVPAPGLEATTMSAVYYPEGAGPAAIAAVREEGVVIAGGLHPAIAPRYFRVGHMGSVTPADTLATIGAIERGLARSGAQLELGAGVAAAQRALA